MTYTFFVKSEQERETAVRKAVENAILYDSSLYNNRNFLMAKRQALAENLKEPLLNNLSELLEENFSKYYNGQETRDSLKAAIGIDEKSMSLYVKREELDLYFSRLQKRYEGVDLEVDMTDLEDWDEEEFSSQTETLSDELMEEGASEVIGKIFDEIEGVLKKMNSVITNTSRQAFSNVNFIFRK